MPNRSADSGSPCANVLRGLFAFLGEAEVIAVGVDQAEVAQAPRPFDERFANGVASFLDGLVVGIEIFDFENDFSAHAFLPLERGWREMVIIGEGGLVADAKADGAGPHLDVGASVRVALEPEDAGIEVRRHVSILDKKLEADGHVGRGRGIGRWSSRRRWWGVGGGGVGRASGGKQERAAEQAAEDEMGDGAHRSTEDQKQRGR